MDKLQNIDLSNVTFLYGTRDQNIGRLTKEEIDFVNSKKVNVIKTDKDHSGVTYIFIDMLTDGRIVF